MNLSVLSLPGVMENMPAFNLYPSTCLFGLVSKIWALLVIDYIVAPNLGGVPRWDPHCGTTPLLATLSETAEHFSYVLSGRASWSTGQQFSLQVFSPVFTGFLQRGLFKGLGVPIIRMMICLGMYCGPPVKGNLKSASSSQVNTSMAPGEDPFSDEDCARAVDE